MKLWQPVATPYSMIVGGSYLASNKYKPYTLADAKKVKNMFSNSQSLYFTVTAFGNNMDFTNGINIVLKQGANVYQAIDITGIDQLPSHTTS
ncbi:hypothetical protein [Paenibacillus glacialis]|uniref:hypothetical protein n=1 Tax=Paenibacillus glacialis TaxID=494026 RepID=UPI0011AB320F|nr:hypothetical protein [Paenibacillus glacialis]